MEFVLEHLADKLIAIYVLYIIFDTFSKKRMKRTYTNSRRNLAARSKIFM